MRADAGTERLLVHKVKQRAQRSVAFCPCMSQYEREASSPPAIHPSFHRLPSRPPFPKRAPRHKTSLVSKKFFLIPSAAGNWMPTSSFHGPILQFSSAVSPPCLKQLEPPVCQTHLHTSFHRCAAQTSCDTSTWGRGPSLRRCAGNRRCRSYKSLSKRRELK